MRTDFTDLSYLTHIQTSYLFPDVQHFLENIIKSLQPFKNHLTPCHKLNIWEHAYRIMP